jgi:hypothetical protein
MRPVRICVLLAAAVFAASAENPVLTVVLDFQGPRSAKSVEEMKREVESVMKSSGLTLDWRTRGEAGASGFDNLVVVRFKGKCILEPVGYLYDERGPLAFTYSTAGEVQPYSEVACDRVSAAARSAMSGRDFAKADVLFGRALGRVVAHEMMHMLARSGAHGHAGVEKAALSGKSLISPEMR